MQVSFNPVISLFTPQKSVPRKSFGLQTDTFCKSDDINFEGRKNTNDLRFMRGLRDLSCPCCGKKMINCDDFLSLDTKIIKGPSKEAFEYLDQFADCLHDKERQYYDYLKGLSEKYPTQDIRGLMMNVRSKHLQNLKNDRIEYPMESLDTFIVYYTRRPRKKEKPASSFQIVKQLLMPSHATVEHIHPWSQKGEDKVGNVLMECADCNGKRGSMDFDKFLKLRPEMQINIYKHLEEIQKKVDNGEFAKYPNYLEEVKETLTKEAKGILNFD